MPQDFAFESTTGPCRVGLISSCLDIESSFLCTDAFGIVIVIADLLNSQPRMQSSGDENSIATCSGI